MSHYTVLVVLPASVDRDQIQDALSEALAPYDENTSVEPYRKYEDDGPENHWFVESVQRGAEHHRAGTGLLPYKPDEIGWSTAWSKKTPDEQRASFADDAAMAERLGPRPTWPAVIAAMTERYGAADSSIPLHEEETGRAYTMSTYNPLSKWDYWRIGGRWAGYFPITGKPGDVIEPERGWDSPEIKAGTCDGGRKRDLDLQALRAAKSAEAETDWNEYWLTVHGTPEALPWRVFAERIDASGNDGYSRDDARRDYRVQPRITALDASEKFRHWFDAHETFEAHGREEYAARQAARAVPGYALLDPARSEEWSGAGRMGWFGCGSDDESSYAEYVRQANDHIDALPDDAWLVIVDCHI